MLNAEQKKGVETARGRILILAGAGSGKTSVITHRIIYLIKNLNISPKAILGLTFTNKAAKEMRKRVAEMIDPAQAKEVSLCTFHSFCMQVLRKEIHRLGYTRNFTLYDERDVRRLVGQLAREILQHEGELPGLDATMDAIAFAKNRSSQPKDDFSKDLLQRLHISMRAYNAVDFDSLLSLTLQLFEEHPDVLNLYQDRFQFIMIDEYQDTNPIQYQLAKLLSAKHGNLCVVGDDDQAIYGWRGAEIKNILRFESDVVIKLEQNYRSTPTILQAANSVIRHNNERHAKELWSQKEKGDPILLFHAPSDLDEASSIVQRIAYYHKHYEIPYKEMAVLYRSNILSRPFEMALMQARIPFQVFGGTEFYERSEIKDLTAYLRAALNPLDQEAMLRIINTPRRGISDGALDTLTQINRTKKIPLWNVLCDAHEGYGLSDKGLNGVKNFVHLIQEMQAKLEKPPYQPTLKWLVDQINYKKAISEEVKSDKMRQFKWENVQAFINNFPEGETSIHDYLSEIQLDNNKWSPEKKFENKVSLMTFHSAKGLEFQLCFLVCLEDQIIPHHKSVHLEEERRLMYVAMTRAKKNLVLSMSRTRTRYGKDEKSNPSRFLFEIPRDLLKVVPWTSNE